MNLAQQTSLEFKLQQQESQTTIAKKYPELFQWKKKALIGFIIMSIFILVDIGILFYLSLNTTPERNVTFLDDIILNTSILMQTKQISHLTSNLLTIWPDINYQYATFITKMQKPSSQLNSFKEIKQEIFDKSNDALLFLFKANDNNKKNYTWSAYIHGQFPLSLISQYNQQISYYTFQTETNKKSSLISVNSYKKYLVTDSNSNDCQIYRIDNNHFTVMDTTIFQLEQKNINLTQKYDCFKDMQGFDKKQILKDILGFNSEIQTSLIEMQVYHLEK